MKTYTFKAGTSKDDMIMGLTYPATFMVPAGIILFFLELLFPNKNITHMATLDILVELGILIPAFIIGGPLARRIKRKCGHQFKVSLENKIMTVKMDNKKIFEDVVEDIFVTEKRQMLKLQIYGPQTDTIFIGRPRNNPFGFSDEYDLSELKRLATDIQELTGN